MQTAIIVSAHVIYAALKFDNGGVLVLLFIFMMYCRGETKSKI